MSTTLGLDLLAQDVERKIGGRILLPLSEVGAMLGLSHAAVAKRHQRGTLGLTTIQLSSTAPLLVPAAEVRRRLGVAQPETEGSAERLSLAHIEIHPDGSIRVIDHNDLSESMH